MLTGVHILLSYTCLYQCEHCFLHCGPDAGNTFTFAQLERLLDQARGVGSVRHICFEGGEPLLFYPLLLHGLWLAREFGFTTEIVTNGYWALHADDAARWLEPLVKAGLGMLDVSDDEYHHGDADPSPAKAALAAAQALGLKTARFTIDPPCVREPAPDDEKGQPIVGGGVRFRGRAADTLTKGLPRRLWQEHTQCPDEDLSAPGRVHVDSLGNVHLCQGVIIGNCWQTTLGGIMSGYDANAHPICGPLLRGGPAGLVEEYDLAPGKDYVDACHLCYRMRQKLRAAHGACLAPDQAYGVGRH